MATVQAAHGQCRLQVRAEDLPLVRCNHPLLPQTRGLVSGTLSWVRCLRGIREGADRHGQLVHRHDKSWGTEALRVPWSQCAWGCNRPSRRYEGQRSRCGQVLKNCRQRCTASTTCTGRGGVRRVGAGEVSERVSLDAVRCLGEVCERVVKVTDSFHGGGG